MRIGPGVRRGRLGYIVSLSSSSDTHFLHPCHTHLGCGPHETGRSQADGGASLSLSRRRRRRRRRRHRRRRWCTRTGRGWRVHPARRSSRAWRTRATWIASNKCVSHRVSPTVYLSPCLPLCLSPVSPSASLPLCLPLCLSHCVFHCVSLSVSPTVSLTVSPSLCLSLSLSLPLSESATSGARPVHHAAACRRTRGSGGEPRQRAISTHTSDPGNNTHSPGFTLHPGERGWCEWRGAQRAGEEPPLRPIRIDPIAVGAMRLTRRHA
jgi:hypothetical protein